jgi:hypothetical protein
MAGGSAAKEGSTGRSQPVISPNKVQAKVFFMKVRVIMRHRISIPFSPFSF